MVSWALPLEKAWLSLREGVGSWLGGVVAGRGALQRWAGVSLLEPSSLGAQVVYS